MRFDLEEYRRGMRERRRSMPQYFVLRRSPKGTWLFYIYAQPGSMAFQCFRFTRWQQAVMFGETYG